MEGRTTNLSIHKKNLVVQKEEQLKGKTKIRTPSPQRGADGSSISCGSGSWEEGEMVLVVVPLVVMMDDASQEVAGCRVSGQGQKSKSRSAAPS